MFKICPEFFYRLQGESEKDLYLKFNTSKDNVLRNNNKINFYKGEWVKIKVNNYIIHIVKPMENLTKISKNYNVQEQTLKDWNNLTSSKLFIGQHIKIYKNRDL